MHTIKRVLAISIAAASVFFAGCASLPTPEVMKAETASFQLPKAPEQGKAMIYVVRPSSLGGLIRFNVFLGDQQDASEMGYTRGSQYIYFNVAPGEHKVFSKAENWSEAVVSVKAGEVAFIQQDASMGLIMARNNIFKVEDYQGKYHIKNTSIGTIIKTDK
jgi:Protein of unknown function (DUF2846)